MMYHDLAYAWHRLDGRVQNAKIDPTLDLPSETVTAPPPKGICKE